MSPYAILSRPTTALFLLESPGGRALVIKIGYRQVVDLWVCGRALYWRYRREGKNVLSFIRMVAVFAMLYFASAGAWATNKCLRPDGKVIFQDTPCAGVGDTVREDLANKEQQRLQRQAETDRIREDTQKQLAAERAAFDERNAAIDRQSDLQLERARKQCGRELVPVPTIGMSEHAFLKCTTFGVLFNPAAINETQTAGVISRQYVYQSVFSPVRYVYTRKGLVTAIQQ